MVSEIQAKRLVVIRAPAGFGKDLARCQLVGIAARQHGSVVAWVAMDADDDETRFCAI
jgi:ATP/maltotriose-dependent transcriptional regulator MalT